MLRLYMYFQSLIHVLYRVSIITLMVAVSWSLYGMETSKDSAAAITVDRVFFSVDKSFPVTKYCKILQTLANALLAQDELAQRACPLIQEHDNVREIEKRVEEYADMHNGTPHYKFKLDINSPQAIIAALRYRNLIADINIAKTNLPVALKLLQHDNPEVQQIGTVIKNKIELQEASKRVEKAVKDFGKLAINVKEWFGDHPNENLAKINSVIPFYTSYLSDLIVNHRQLMKDTDFDDYQMTMKNNDIFMEKLKAIIKAYKNVQQDRHALYQKAMKILRQEVLTARKRKITPYSGGSMFDYLKKLFGDQGNLPSTIISDQIMASKIEVASKEEEQSKRKPKKKKGKGKNASNKKGNQKQKQKAKKLEGDDQQNNSLPEITASYIIDIPTMSDESYLLKKETCSDYATIIDPKNSMKLCLYTSADVSPVVIPMNINYTPNINDWFDDSQQALEKQGYTTLGHKNYTAPEDRQRMIQIHNFALAVDQLIQQKGKQIIRKSRIREGQDDICITIPGHVEFLDTRIRETCLFVYLIDAETGKWYHRNIEFRTGRQLIEEFWQKGYYEVEFPALS